MESKQLNNYYSIEIKKTQQQLVDVINDCKLPFNVQLLIINNLTNLINNYAEQEYAHDLQLQAQELEELEKEKENNESSESEENN